MSYLLPYLPPRALIYINHLSQPPPPDWLSAALAALLKSYPTDSFEAMMRYCAINTDTNAFVSPLIAAPPGEPLPPNIQFAWLPRIRCRDCPGKSYTAGPDTTVQNFEVHLKNRAHRERVLARLGKGMAPSAPPPQGAGA
jgi:SWI/SNF-related matrix-associated actin-dependent regulator of chromatin subfamily B protein 1